MATVRCSLSGSVRIPGSSAPSDADLVARSESALACLIRFGCGFPVACDRFVLVPRSSSPRSSIASILASDKFRFDLRDGGVPTDPASAPSFDTLRGAALLPAGRSGAGRREDMQRNLQRESRVIDERRRGGAFAKMQSETKSGILKIESRGEAKREGVRMCF